jgi:hypothetical protein
MEQTASTDSEVGEELARRFLEHALLETLIGLLEDVDLVENPVRLILDNLVPNKKPWTKE